MMFTHFSARIVWRRWNPRFLRWSIGCGQCDCMTLNGGYNICVLKTGITGFLKMKFLFSSSCGSCKAEAFKPADRQMGFQSLALQNVPWSCFPTALGCILNSKPYFWEITITSDVKVEKKPQIFVSQICSLAVQAANVIVWHHLLADWRVSSEFFLTNEDP